MESSSSSHPNNWLNIGLTVSAIIILLFLIGSYYNHRIKGHKERFDNQDNIHTEVRPYTSGPIVDNISIQSNEVSNINAVVPQKGLGHNEVFSSVPVEESRKDDPDPFGLKSNQYPADCYPKGIHWVPPASQTSTR